MIVDDNNFNSWRNSSTDEMHSHYVPRPTHLHKPKKQTEVHEKIEYIDNKPVKCKVLTKTVTRCAELNDAIKCVARAGCKWDTEMLICENDEDFFKAVLWSGVLVPLLYVICYFLGNQSQIQSMWKNRNMMHVVYMTSVFLATCSILYLIINVISMNTFMNRRYDYAAPLLTLFVGAMSLPVFRLLWIVRDYSRYYIFASLFTTSAGIVWFMTKYMKDVNMSKDVASSVSLYYALFHILLMDNFVWWWFLFVDSKSV